MPGWMGPGCNKVHLPLVPGGWQWREATPASSSTTALHRPAPATHLASQLPATPLPCRHAPLARCICADLGSAHKVAMFIDETSPNDPAAGVTAKPEVRLAVLARVITLDLRAAQAMHG